MEKTELEDLEELEPEKTKLELEKTEKMEPEVGEFGAARLLWPVCLKTKNWG